jgi:hypothetical protein
MGRISKAGVIAGRQPQDFTYPTSYDGRTVKKMGLKPMPHPNMALAKITGLHINDRHLLWELQGGKCAICGKDVDFWDGEHVVLDHDHSTNRARGVLCKKCNTSVGYFETWRSEVEAYLAKVA